MHFGSLNYERFSIEQEGLFAYTKIVRFSLWGRTGGVAQQTASQKA